MEIKAILQKPFSFEQKRDFIIAQNREHGYEIRETETALEAWGYTQEEKEAQERERINKLSLTKREVFLAIYRDKQITPDQIRSMITSEEGLIEFDFASSYFRGNPLIGMLGEALGYTPYQLDQLFITGEIPTDVNEQENLQTLEDTVNEENTEVEKIEEVKEVVEMEK